jgi:hypothetical protein
MRMGAWPSRPSPLDLRPIWIGADARYVWCGSPMFQPDVILTDRRVDVPRVAWVCSGQGRRSDIRPVPSGSGGSGRAHCARSSSTTSRAASRSATASSPRPRTRCARPWPRSPRSRSMTCFHASRPSAASRRTVNTNSLPATTSSRRVWRSRHFYSLDDLTKETLHSLRGIAVRRPGTSRIRCVWAEH